MAFRIRDIIDAGLNAITNITYEILSSDPSNTLGRFHLNSTSKRVKYYDGTTMRSHATIDDSLSTFATPTGDVAWGSHKITGLTDPSNPQEAATKNYVDAVAAGLNPRNSVNYATAAALPAYGYVTGVITATANGVWTIDGQSLTVGDRVLVKNGAAGSDNGIYTVTTVGTGAVKTVLTRATDFNSATNVNQGDYTLVETGTTNALKGYVVTSAGPYTIGTTTITFSLFSAAGSVSTGNGAELVGTTITGTPPMYRACRVVQTTNMVSLSAPGATIDGISMAAGDRVLLTGQTSASQNGPWVWNGAAVAMTRPTDYAAGDTAQALSLGQANVFAGTVGAGTEWYITTTGAITIDTTSTTWVQLPVQVGAPGVVGVLPIANGGTSAATAAAARTALGIGTKFVQSIGDGATNPLVVTHGLGTVDILAQVVEVSTGNVIYCGVQATSTTTATVTFSVVATTNQYRITIYG